MRVYTYTHRGWAHRQRVSTTFLAQTKFSQMFLVLLMRCPTVVEAHCYKCLGRLVLCTHQRGETHINNTYRSTTLAVVQLHSAHRILYDFSPRSSASALVAQLGLNNLSQRKTKPAWFAKPCKALLRSVHRLDCWKQFSRSPYSLTPHIIHKNWQVFH